MILKSEKVILRPFCNNDIEIIYQWRNDKNLRLLTITHPFPVTKDQEKQWLSLVIEDKSNKNIVFACEVVDSNELCGYFQLREINLIHKHAFLGIVIGDKNYRGKGIGREMMSLGINYGFNMLGLHKISLEVLESNDTAIKLYSSLGFIQEGVFSKHFFFDGNWHTVIRMAKFN